ncbi:DUF998 domain-containing protein [Gracilibacillus alcaliphilus]|uniref:DUF998 domain-containing protein n=1 Tax=Gracilibacillus alcaliphilus TaxID=1401441 RepID=UPI00195783A4|nr:DUF998 domain-containing protein [Gracilibacillus alcaliphilus]MBM7676208.1 hypothetical protein [Gracilibacillus alcaliphilus]
MDTPYIMMLIVTLLAIIGSSFLPKSSTFTIRIGAACWILLSTYFVIEWIVLRASTAFYSVLRQPMSDLGVTACGTDTYVLASYEICSPYHLWMNWTFTLTGLAIAVGAVCLHSCWPQLKQTKIATGLLIVLGVSYSLSGIFPANVNFDLHTWPALLGMLVQIPALILIARSIRPSMPKLAVWTWCCTVLTSAAFLLICLQPMVPSLPGGLLQRIFYGAVFLWMVVTGVVLWRNKD